MASRFIDLPVPAGSVPAGRVIFMDGVRAAAIFGVVSSHCARLLSQSAQHDPLAIAWIANLLHTGTSIFVFVAGFLFAYLARPGWSFGGYLLNKCQRVLIPYAVISLVLIACAVPLAFITPRLVIEILMTGGAGLSLWYIPFVIWLYLLAPIFLRFREAPFEWRWSILAASLLLGLLVHRPPGNHDNLQSLAYFVFFYLAGIETQLHMHRLSDLVQNAGKWLPLLGAALIASSSLQGIMIGYWGTTADWFQPAPPDLWYPTNILLIACLCALFISFRDLNRGLLRRIADDSFGIFFVHNLVLLVLMRMTDRFTLTGLHVPDLLIVSPLVFAASWAIVLLIKRLSGRASRYLIGA